GRGPPGPVRPRHSTNEPGIRKERTMTRDALKTRIKDLAGQGRGLRERIQATSGLERHALWLEKRRIGRQARAAFLAYGFLRGVPYERIERHCHRDGRPQPVPLLSLWASQLGIRPVWRAQHPFGSGLQADATDAGEVVWSETRLAAWLQAASVAGSS